MVLSDTLYITLHSMSQEYHQNTPHVDMRVPGDGRFGRLMLFTSSVVLKVMDFPGGARHTKLLAVHCHWCNIVSSDH